MKTKNAQKGQALLFVVVAMTVALAVGVAVSSRTLSSLRRTTNTDTSTRVVAAAEGGVEWFLRQPASVLETLADANGSNSGAECPTGTSGVASNSRACLLTYSPTAGDAVTAQAVVEINEFVANSEAGDHYWFMLDSGDVKEIRLVNPAGTTFYNGDLRVCWESSDPTLNSGAIYYQIYNSTGVTTKNIIGPRTVIGTFDVLNFDQATYSVPPYSNCYDINGINNQFGLRLKGMYVPSRVAVFPLDAGFPTQGYRITSIGQVVNSNSAITSTKELVVYRSFTYMPAALDYAIYSNGPLGNN